MIRTNLLSQVSQQHLRQIHNGTKVAVERLSSGLRINRAGDDAAGQAIANRMDSNLRAANQITRGINDGISLMQTAEGGLDTINNILQRARELAVQASNGTLNDSDRAVINAEYLQLRDEIDRISKQTEVFGKYPLAPLPGTTEQGPPQPQYAKSLEEVFGASGTWLNNQQPGTFFIAHLPEGTTDVELTLYAHATDDDLQLFDREGTHIAGTPVTGDTDYTWRTGGVNSAADVERQLFAGSDVRPGASYSVAETPAFYEPGRRESAFTNDGKYRKVAEHDGMTISYTGDPDRFAPADRGGARNDGDSQGVPTIERLHIDKVSKPLFIAVTGDYRGTYEIKAEWKTPPPPPPKPIEGAVEIVTGAGFGQEIDKITILPAPADHVSLGLEDVALDPWEKAQEALKQLQTAMAKIDGMRGEYGALRNRFDSAIDNLGQQTINTSVAKSRIQDADYAVESANKVKQGILNQATTAMLAQANQTPSQVLSLLEAS